jgi:putative hemolysin
MVAALWSYLPGAATLLALSGFFSGSEAAFFSSTPAQRRSLVNGNRAERVAAALLNRSERLLMGILFWNLAINIGYFSLISRIALQFEQGAGDHSSAAIVTLVALLTIILFGEFLPKSVAVMYPIMIIRIVALPLSLAIRALDFILPVITFLNEASRRLLWPGLKAEPYLESSDLDRAVELSTGDARLFEQESQVLRNIIQLSDIRVEEWMRPRTEYRIFVPPIEMSQLNGEKTPSGYMLISDADGKELVSAIDLRQLLPHQSENLQRYAHPVTVVPWCTTIADALERLRGTDCKVAVVVNEHGETIGVLTWEDVFEAILQVQSVKSHREFARAEVRQESENVWIATGMTRLRKLERVFGQRINEGNNLTVGGLIQEQLHRLPEMGDVCMVEAFEFEVTEAGQRGEILVRIRYSPPVEDASGENA